MGSSEIELNEVFREGADKRRRVHWKKTPKDGYLTR